VPLVDALQPAHARPLAQDLRDLQRLIHYVQRRRAELILAAGDAFDRRALNATILLGKLWSASLDLRLRGARLT
jgi:hypothetical protein